MGGIFSFRKKKDNQQQQLSPLLIEKLDRIIELLEQQKEPPGRTIHFDHVQIDHLENIIFRLDSIEIDELSGKFMIGNNMNTTEDLAKTIFQKINKDAVKQDMMKESDEEGATITKTGKGYRFRNSF